MAKYNFNLANKELIDNMRSPSVYKYNLAQNLALLSNDPSVIRRFYQVEIARYFQDVWLTMEAEDMFMAQYIKGQAFAYFGIIPMIVQGKVNLVASNGFVCKSDNKDIDEALNKIKEEANLEKLFEDGVYYESGLGDFAYRISCHRDISETPIIDVIEPQQLEVNYVFGKIKSFVIKKPSSEDANYEIREIHYKNDEGFVCIDYRFAYKGHYVDPTDSVMVKQCEAQFPYHEKFESITLPFKDFLIVFKKNTNASKLYKGERGVPDIQGMASIEDALTESISDLIDAIRKGGVKEFVSEELIPQDENGQDLRVNKFNKTIITTRGSSNPASNQELYQVVQGNINWEAYTRTIQNLMSVAINKAGLAPTTLGLTGLESINSSAESQDAREKTSLRTRSLCLKEWNKTLKELFNKYLQARDYMNGRTIVDYSEYINISFNEYTSPSVENVTDILTKQVAAGIKSRQTAIKELNDGLSDEEIEQEFLKIQDESGQPVMEMEESEEMQ